MPTTDVVVLTVENLMTTDWTRFHEELWSNGFGHRDLPNRNHIPHLLSELERYREEESQLEFTNTRAQLKRWEKLEEIAVVVFGTRADAIMERLRDTDHGCMFERRHDEICDEWNRMLLQEDILDIDALSTIFQEWEEFSREYGECVRDAFNRFMVMPLGEGALVGA